jgi:methyl-accepting chemotaxis protein
VVAKDLEVSRSGEADAPLAATGRLTAIWIGWAIGFVLLAGGGWLVELAVRAGAPAALLPVFLVIGVLAGIAHYVLVVGDHVSSVEPWWGNRDVARAFHELGAGDLPRGRELAEALPGSVRGAFAGTAEALANLAQRIQDGSIRLAGSAEGVDGVASELASGASQQAASVVEITAAMEELSRTAAQISQSAAEQADLAARAEGSGLAGAAAVDGAVEGLAQVQQQIVGMSARADALGTRSKEIFRVLDLITEIAQETHILSLNAAIEAAAAGDRGKRFSVVAEEVRRLAQQTRESVDSVRGLLEEFAGAIRSAVVATEEGSKEVTRVLERARAGAGAIGELRDTAAETARVARQISSVTQQQTAASEEVLITLRDLNQVVQRMSRDLQELSDNAKRLRRVGVTTQLLAQTFHLDSPRSLKHVAERWLDRLRALPAAELDAALAELVRESPYAQCGFFADADGRGVAIWLRDEVNAPPHRDDARRIDVRERPWFRVLVRERRTVVSEPHVSLAGGESCFTVAAPRIDPDGALTGAVAIDVSVSGWTRI